MAEIPKIINGLTKTRPSIQQATVEKYFIPSLSFRHPLCTVPSFRGSRWVYLKVLQWYKIMSPRTESEIHSIGGFEVLSYLIGIGLIASRTSL